MCLLQHKVGEVRRRVGVVFLCVLEEGWDCSCWTVGGLLCCVSFGTKCPKCFEWFKAVNCMKVG